MKKQTCAVCGTAEGLIRAEMNHFQRVCAAHKKYATYFQLDKVKLELGYIDKLPDSCCAICDKPLSPEENKSIAAGDFIKTCAEHRWMSKFYINTLEFRQQYKEGKPFMLNGLTFSKEHPNGEFR